jgi:propionyl-CoA carboxylase alpha chain
VQVLGDSHGTLVYLGERECSIQRRHQKIIEESPSPIVDSDMRRAMGEAALRLAKAIDYESAGTVEFLVDDESRDFYFLEVNTRIQVEHPVTEEVTGIDLVREQLRVAAGAPLGFSQDDITFTGHAIEARLYAEDPSAGFLPATGELAAYCPPADPAVRWDSGVETGSIIGVDFDPMMAKVIAHSPTRGEAAGKLALALERLHLAGVTTNRTFLVNTLRHPSFLAGDTTTDFIERVTPSTEMNLGEGMLAHARIAAALWLQGHNRASAPVLGKLPSGWRNGPMPAQHVELVSGEDRTEIRYRPSASGFQAWVGEGEGFHSAHVQRWGPDEIDLEVDGYRAVHRVTRAGDLLYVQIPQGTLEFAVVSRFVTPGLDQTVGAVLAPMPGVVSEVRVASGDTVSTGDVLVILEAMKMEHHLKAPSRCTVVEVCVQAGEHVQNGTTLLVLDESLQEESQL